MEDDSFAPAELDRILTFLARWGYAVLRAAYSSRELAELNAFCDSTQRARPAQWDGGLADKVCYNPLLMGPAAEALDPYTRHPGTFAVVDAALGGQARFAEFVFRETVADTVRAGGLSG
jgi:hypothetical protein